MANKIEYTNVFASRFVLPTSRYIDSDVIYYGDEKITTFATYKKSKFKQSKDDKVAVIPNNMQYRPDLVSKKKYGTVDFWWKIMEVNDIKDVMEFTAGRTITLPGNIYG